MDICLSSAKLRHYESLGYNLPRRKTRDGLCVPRGAKITVRINDLPNGSHVKVTKICDICGKELPGISYRDIIKRRMFDSTDKCKPCSQVVQCRSQNESATLAGNSLSNVIPALVAEWHPTLNGNLLPSDVTPASHAKVWWACSDCRHEWVTAVYARKAGTGCPICCKSRGERQVYAHLRGKGIPFLTQVSVPSLVGVGGNPLVFDFVINSGSNAFIIEYDGEQHFRPVDFLGNNQELAQARFEWLCEHDRRKNEWCVQNGVPLFRIKYTDFTQIPQIIDAALEKYYYTEVD